MEQEKNNDELCHDIVEDDSLVEDDEGGGDETDTQPIVKVLSD